MRCVRVVHDVYPLCMCVNATSDRIRIGCIIIVILNLEPIQVLIYIYVSMISSTKAIEEILRRRAKKNGNEKQFIKKK